VSKFGPLVSPKWLREHIAEPDLRVVDFRWYLTGRQGRDAYLAGHIPGAVFVDLDAVADTTEVPGRDAPRGYQHGEQGGRL
jgi:thiosulfate/3-mercaptopyruvate sulfurtransferase